MKPWERYADIIDDVEAFRAACERPLPTVVRVNTLKTTPDRAIAALETEGLDVETRDWHAATLAVGTDTPGRTWPYQHGWIHGQEEISQLPPQIFDLSADASVLDIAAAPGGKATQLAARVDPGGIVVANDVNLGRLKALRANADRLGVSNMLVTNQDAREFSPRRSGVEAFDAVLVDAPCSGEGTVRKTPPEDVGVDETVIEDLAALQTGILRRAVDVTRPGGTVVYSTCTFAPEENEGVLSRLLQTHASVAVVPFDSPLAGAEGVTRWHGEEYPAEVRHARRYYPHLNDTGGFFCAKLEVGA